MVVALEDELSLGAPGAAVAIGEAGVVLAAGAARLAERGAPRNRAHRLEPGAAEVAVAEHGGHATARRGGRAGLLLRHEGVDRPRASRLAPLGVTTLVLAVVADVGTSLLVTLNALRLLRLDGHDRGR